ncbi:MAG TPA: adenylate/guanylate cyclase domain-containing protein [Acidimicrobiales bacterium]|nr:adenylate/guanylate cyclase domain-containing protein [Acidimicrobiales bacterium]
MPPCPRCDAANPDGYRFCGQCGAALALAECPSCGTPTAAGQQFCGQCGTGLDGRAARSDPPAVEERKLATVLFADVVGFTSLAERTDPEVVARIVDVAFRELGEVVAEHGGTVDKYMGDSVMAVFGVPVAHDDDAERAVAAALAMRHVGGDLVFSIGVNSGEVMATAVGGGEGITVIGDTVNVAARLEKAAGPGEVLCGHLTAELTRGRVALRARQPVLLKGKREPVEVWEAVALRGDDVEPDTAAPLLVGRDDELAFLEAQWRRVCRDRQAHVVLVCGDAGSGKSRLVSELARVAERDGTVVRSTYPAYGALGGARVAADVIRQLGPVDDPEVNARVRSIAGDLDASLQSIDPAGMQQEQLWAFGRLLHEKGARRPVVIMIDDMHRSGDRTLEVLGELIGRLGDVPLLTVLTGRTEPGEWLTRFPAATTVRLGPLGRVDASALAAGFVCDKPLASEAADFLVDRAGGNPLYLRELVAMARAQGLLVDDGHQYRLTAYGAIPATLQALLAARLDSLEPAQKLALQHAAVLGEATLEQIAGLGTPDAPGALRALVEGGLLRHGPDGRYDAADPLLREVAYETLPRNMRGDLHRRAAAMAEGPEERARHLDRAARYLADDEAVVAEATEALADAGRAFLRQSRHVDAVRLFERAVALGCRRPSVLLDLAKVQALCGKQEDAFETLAMVDDDPDDPTIGIERDHTAANTKIFTDPGWALPQLEAVTERWRALGVADKEAWGHANTGVALFYLGRMEEAGRELELALALFERIGDRVGGVAASSFMCLAKPTDRRVPAWLADALEFADAAGDRSRQITTLMTLTWHHFIRSLWGGAEDTAQTEGFARRLAALGEEIGAGDMAVHGLSLLAITARFGGRFDEAAAHVDALQRLGGIVDAANPWLGWAASFVLALGGGATGAAPPHPPDASLDPVVAMSELVIEAELTVAGRIDEALARAEATESLEMGPIGELAGLLNGLALVLAGRATEARPCVELAADAARALGAGPTAAAAAALLAEITGDVGVLPRAPASAGSVSDAVVLRAHAVLGDADAARALRRAAQDLAVPGLLLGL